MLHQTIMGHPAQQFREGVSFKLGSGVEYATSNCIDYPCICSVALTSFLC